MKLKNVLIVVSDMERSKRFYRDLFGLPVILEQEGNVILALGSRSYVPFDPEGLAPEVYTVGDAVKARDAKWAIYEGYRTAQKI